MDKYIKILRYILIIKIIDFTGLVELIFEEIILKFRVPDRIISNRGSIFINTFWLKVYYLIKIKRRLSTVFYP